MALIDNRRQRTIMLCAMYFAQGLPWGFMVTALVAYLADEHGISDSEAAGLTAVVLLPWTFKLVWAPLIDSVTIASMGRRRPWIISAEVMMAVSLLGILAMGDLSENLSLLGGMFFLHNCFASLQDVATDALAIDVLPSSEQGRVNGLMWGSKLIGKAIGASGMAWIIYQWDLPAAVMVQFILLLVIMLFPLLWVERPGDKLLPWMPRPAYDSVSQTQVSSTPGNSEKFSFGALGRRNEPVSEPITGGLSASDTEVASSVVSLRNPFDVLRDLWRGFSVVASFTLLIYGVFEVVGWGIIEVVYKTLYTQQLGWDYVDLSSWTGMAVFPEMVGAFLGGYFADRFGPRKVIAIGFGTYGMLAILFGSCPGLWGESWFAVGYIVLNPGTLAFGAVGFLSLGMRVSWTLASASMFTIYMTLSNVGHVIGNYFAGQLRENWLFSYQQTFCIAGLVTVVPLLLLLLIRPEEFDRRKAIEQAD